MPIDRLMPPDGAAEWLLAVIDHAIERVDDPINGKVMTERDDRALAMVCSIISATGAGSMDRVNRFVDAMWASKFSEQKENA